MSKVIHFGFLVGATIYRPKTRADGEY